MLRKTWPRRGCVVLVMTFNLRRDVPEDGPNAWPHRRALVARLVEEAAPHVLGTQEGLPHQLADLDEALPAYARVGAPRSPRDEACALYYRRDAFDLVASGDLWLSDAPGVAGSRSWGNRVPRVVTWATLRERAAPGRATTFANTHLDHESAASRARSAAFLAERFPGAVLLGDLNDAPGEPSHQALLDAGWRDAAGPDAPGTYHGYSGVARSRIDHVLAPRGLAVRSHRVVVQEGPRWPSDHHPVLVELAHDA